MTLQIPPILHEGALGAQNVRLWGYEYSHKTLIHDVAHSGGVLP